MVDIPVDDEAPFVLVDVVTEGQTIFDFDFRADAVEDLRALYKAVNGATTFLVGGFDFTATGLTDPDGGSIVITSGLLTEIGAKLAIYRVTTISRPTDYSRDLFAEEINRDMDKIFMILQEISRDLGRSVKVQVGALSFEFSTDLEVGDTLMIGAGNVIGKGPNATDIAGAQGYAAEALAWKNLAQRYANEEEDVSVIPGEFSAKHWAKKSEDAALLAMSNHIVRHYAGTGTSVPLELGANPGSINNVQVLIRGLGVQPTGLFSLVGTTIVPLYGEVWPAYNEAEDVDGLGWNIEIRFGGALDIGVPSDGSVTAAKLANSSVTASKIDPASVGDIQALLGIVTRKAFSAHKNGVAQSGILPDTATKITFGTEAWDDGGYYDPAQSRYTPPAGKYRIGAALYWSGTVAGSEYSVELWKNGVMVKSAYVRASTTAAGVHAVASWLVEVDGDDYLEIYGRGGGAGNKTVNGTASYNYFEGEAL